MEFPPLLEGRLVDRYKRFFADVRLADGQTVTAHCPNPGSMRNCRPDNARVWLSKATNPKRKLRFSWELVEVDAALVAVNTGRANQVVAEALEAGAIEELTGYDRVRPEVRYGERSRVDFLLERGENDLCYVEVKNVTLGVGGGVTAFPDSVTERGTRHLNELSAVVSAGHRAVLLFCAARSDTRVVRPADDIDPVYGRALRAAAAAGVEILAYGCEVSIQGLWLRNRLPVDLSQQPEPTE